MKELTAYFSQFYSLQQRFDIFFKTLTLLPGHVINRISLEIFAFPIQTIDALLQIIVAFISDIQLAHECGDFSLCSLQFLF